MIRTNRYILPLLLLAAVGPVQAAAPRTIAFQGVLTTATGTRVEDGAYPVTLRLYDVLAGGTPLWTESKTVAVRTGLFSTTLGDTTPFPFGLVFDRPYWLSVTDKDGAEMTPRVPLHSVPYALSLALPHRALESSDVSLLSITNSGPGRAAHFETANTGGNAIAVSGQAAGNGIGVYGFSAEGQGVFGVSGGVGLQGIGREGVRGESTQENGNGIVGQSDQGPAAYGVWGISRDGIGVVGQSAQSDGVRGITQAATGRGVYGQTGTGIGVLGEAGAGGGVGVRGENYHDGWPVIGIGSLRGVLAQTTNWDGIALVAGHQNNANISVDLVYGRTYAIRASNDNEPGHWAGWFGGQVHVNGNLSKSAGSFLIDHPLDPANRYLRHSFVESPDMKNVYDGIAILDANGEAWVDLPPYFEALNRDFRYQLTAIGSSQPGLYIASKVQGNRFKIAGGTASAEVSWLVTGIRQDAYARAHPMKVEEDKPESDRGRYLAPEAFGLPMAASSELRIGSH